MGWTYLVESVESAKDLSNGLSQSFTVKETDMFKQCCCREWPLMTSNEHQSGMTLHRLEGPCYQLSTSSMGASHAKTSVMQVIVSAWKGSEVAYSLKLSGLQKKLTHLSSFLKTSLASGQEDLLVFVSSWPRWGMICGGQLSVPQALEPRTKGIDGLYLPTPTVCGNYNRPKKGTSSGTGLATYVTMFPTPTASEYGTQKGANGQPRPSLSTMARQNKWPTPVATDWKRNGSPSDMRRNSPPLGSLVAHQSGGMLNPQWVEWLMGYPSGWTELSAWAIPWFQNKSQKHSKS